MNNFYKLISCCFSLIAVILLMAINAQARPEDGQSEVQSLLQALKITVPLHFCNEPVPVDETDVQERLERELLIALNDRDSVILWLKRSSRYFPYIEQALKDHSLPDDLKYVVIAESSLKPLATSYKGAVGFWQFIESTGNRYGMKITGDIDERRNLYTSTSAAIKYFQDLYANFNSWTLAAAAYNMGEDGLKTEMLMQKERNYYRLYLNEETQRYLFRILTAKMILSNPGKYGYSLKEDDLYKPLLFDTIEITINDPVPIHVIAKAANTYFKVIKDLNPHIKNYHLYPGKYNILIPRGASSGFINRYDSLLKQYVEEKGRSVYTVKNGDSLYIIAKRFNVSLKAIMLWNGISNGKNVSPGDQLLIFTESEKPASSEKQ
jgi:membrane-bound lytic murein transglycosylase D